MVTAYVLITCELGKESEVASELHKIEEVKEAHVVYGQYDVIAKLQDDSSEQVHKAITLKIRRMKGIKATLTLMEIEGQS